MRINNTVKYWSLFSACIITALTLSGCNTTGSNSNNPWDNTKNSVYPQSDIASVYDQKPAAGGASRLNFANLPPVKVGVLLPLSGKHERIGQAMLQAAQLAVFDMGYENFELIPRDTRGTPEGAKEAATSAIHDGAKLILGPLFADSVRAAKQAASRKNVNLIAFSTDWALAGNNTYVMGFLPFAQVQRVTRYAAASGMRDIASLAPADKYGDTVVSAFKREANANAMNITRNMRYQPSSRDLTRDVATFTNGLAPTDNMPVPHIDAVFMPAGGVHAKTLASALSYYGLTPREVRRIGTGLFDDPSLMREPNLQGAWFAAPSPKGRQAFENQYRSTFGDMPPRVASLAYDATALAGVLAATGFQRGTGPAFDKTSITNRNGFNGIDGIFRFGRDGLVERGLAVLEIRNGRFVEISPAPTTFQSHRITN